MVDNIFWVRNAADGGADHVASDGGTGGPRGDLCLDTPLRRRTPRKTGRAGAAPRCEATPLPGEGLERSCRQETGPHAPVDQPTGAAGELAPAAAFAAGTRIMTPRGPVPVESLRDGDLVETLDDGPQPLRWVGEVTLSATDLALRPEFRPVRIRAHAFGPGLPARDMRLAPDTRLKLSHWRAELEFGAAEVLVAVRHLADGDRIAWPAPEGPVHYVHIMCEAHQLILADGIETETALGPEPRAALPGGLRPEGMALWPQDGALRAARPVLRGWEGRMLARAVLPPRAEMQGDQARSA